MNPSPPKKEAALSHAAPSETYAAETVTESSSKVNGKPLPPDGYAFADIGEGEAPRLEPITAPDTFTADEKERLDVILPVCRWAIGSKARLAALEFLGGLDTRTVAEIAKTHKISASVVHREIGKLRAFIGAMR